MRSARPFVIHMIILVVTTGISLNAQSSNPNAITEAMLKDHGLRLPAYQTIADLMKYQIDLPTHQELTIQWKSIAGHSEPLSKKEADAMPLSPDFSLQAQKHSLPTGVGRLRDDLGEDTLVVASATSRGEIRSLNVQYDERMVHGEDLRPGRKPERVDVVFPEVTFTIRVPDDPQITRIVFFKPRYSGQWHLDQVGEIQLTPQHPNHP